MAHLPPHHDAAHDHSSANGFTTPHQSVLTDYCIQASSVRLPFIAAGLVNSAVAVLLSQLSARFFEMAILDRCVNNERSTLSQEAPLVPKNIGLNTLTSTEPSHQLPTLDQAIPSTHTNCPTLVQSNELQSMASLDVSAFRIKNESDIDMGSFLMTGDSVNTIRPPDSQTAAPYGFQAMDEASMNLPVTTSRVLTVDYSKRYPCNYRGCGKVFFSRSSLFYHKQAHVIEKPYLCTYAGCGLSFSTDALLRGHVKLHEAKLSNIQFPCNHPGCGKIFINHDRLTEHIRIHTGERPYVCDYPGCTHRFARRGNLFAHKRVHLDKTQRRQYHCIHPGCGKTFLYARSLTEHMNVHMGERPYACDFPNCDKRFTSKSYLYAHRRTHIGSEGQPQCSQDPCNTYTGSNPITSNPPAALNPFSQVSQSTNFPLHYHPAFYPDNTI